MNNKNIKGVALILTLAVVLGAALPSCTPVTDGADESSSEISSESSSTSESLIASESESESTSESESESTSESVSESESSSTSESDNSQAESTANPTESDTNAPESSDTNTPEGSDTNAPESSDTNAPEVDTSIKDSLSASITEANKTAGKVNAYFDSPARDNLVVENDNVILDLGLNKENDGYVTVRNKLGRIFLDDAFRPYIKTADLKYYYGTESIGGSDTNIYRLGYYMYDVHVFGGDFFADGAGTVDQRTIPFTKMTNMKMVEEINKTAVSFTYKVTDATDPRIYFEDLSAYKLDASSIGFMKFTMKSEYCSGGQIFIITDTMEDQESFKYGTSFTVTSDGEYHEYIINLSAIQNFSGKIKKLRIDVGSAVGETIEINNIQFFGIEGDLPAARYDRTLYVYNDKINQVLHLISPRESENVIEYGFETKIPVDMVESFIVEDSRGVFDTPDRINWRTVTYVGFDIKDVGVFGIITVNDELASRIKVTCDGEYYTIYNYGVPATNVLEAGEDIYIGQRLYFGDTHSFEELQFEAWCEHNPLGEENFIVTYEGSPMGRFSRYDGLRGAYKFDVRYGNWNNIFFYAQNMHYNVNVTVKGDGVNRKIYVYTAAVANGQTLECAVLMDKNNVLLPLPLEVCKNFAGDGEENEFLKDIGYSEVYFPLIVGGGDEFTLTIAHLYQNWGKFPLKQIDSIQYYTPFYHLSCGVTETNCLRPYYTCNEVKNTSNIYCLPDHRAMSAPLWTESKGSSDPQHTNGGFHNMLEYFGSDGYVTTEFVSNVITSYGPTYAEITMDYITDDGKIKVSYTHIEMPQTDENRAFYICTYEFLDDLTVTDAKKNFSFYSVTGRYVDYGKIGYLDENNESKIVDNTLDGTAEYLLGDECPYFDCFKWVSGSAETENDYVNVGCLVYNYDVKMGGESFNEGLLLYVEDGWAHLTLNAETLNFKKGDKISLNMILVPWGSQISDYEREDADFNIREIRNNTLLDPVTVTAANGNVVNGAFMPRVESLDGKSAEFTISGGENNVAVEILGMCAIARPKVEEKIGDEWVVYDYTSSEIPDGRGTTHDYDGYMIRYLDEGSYAYSFVVDMNGDAERTFRVTVE